VVNKSAGGMGGGGEKKGRGYGGHEKEKAGASSPGAIFGALQCVNKRVAGGRRKTRLCLEVKRDWLSHTIAGSAAMQASENARL